MERTCPRTALIVFLIDQNEEKLREVLQFCNACGAICTTQKGAIPALPTTATALELISKGSD